VIIDHSASGHESRDEPEQRTANRELDLLDKRVLTDIGDELGTLEDIDFDPSDGHLERLTINDENLDPARLLGIGAYAIIGSAQDDSD
jgi:sporulation protein YlmC with PRC-barrel domain